ncbi:MAG: zf-HC2 domain-containing protein [Candidatus Latescibacteria bacterium]|nr:zf-HC2 domain-containing protein [Candidatus Latescibacterota bacterium]
MKCRECENNLAAYIDGMLSEEMKQRVEEHIETCRNCAGQLAVQRLIASSLSGAEPVGTPDGLADRILAAAAKKLPENVVDFNASREASSASVDCRTFRDHVAAFVEGAAPRALQKGLEEHRAACYDCGRLARVHTVILSSLGTAEPVAAPPGLADRILAAALLREEATAKATGLVGSGFFIAASVSVTAAASIVLGILSSWNRIPELWNLFYGTVSWMVAGYSADVGRVMESPSTGALIMRFNELTARLAATVKVPHIGVSFPLYYLVALGALTAYFIWYIQDTPSFETTEAL